MAVRVRVRDRAGVLRGLVPGPKSPLPRVAPEPTAGPGTELRKLLHQIGIKPMGPRCKCNEHAREMDRGGPDWCEQNMETILDWLEAEAKTRPLVGRLFSRTAARQIVKLAIRRARAALTSAAI